MFFDLPNRAKSALSQRAGNACLNGQLVSQAHLKSPRNFIKDGGLERRGELSSEFLDITLRLVRE